MTLKKFAQKNYFYLTVASMYFIQSKLKIFHSFIHFMSAPIPKWMISSLAILKKVYWRVAWSNLIIYFGHSTPTLKSCWLHQKKKKKTISIVSTVPLDETIYWVRHIKVCKIQNQSFPGVLQDIFLRVLLNSQKDNSVGVSFLRKL